MRMGVNEKQPFAENLPLAVEDGQLVYPFGQAVAMELHLEAFPYGQCVACEKFSVMYEGISQQPVLYAFRAVEVHGHFIPTHAIEGHDASFLFRLGQWECLFMAIGFR